MKPFQAQTFYELLEVSVSASPADIRAAFERLDRLFQEGQNALYGLADTGHQTALRKRMKEAVDVLTDDELRALYDQEIGLPPRDVSPPPAPLKLEPDPVPVPIPSAPEPPPVPVLAQKPDVEPPPSVVEAHQPVMEEAAEAGQMSMGDLLANVDATSTRPVAFTYERAGPPPPEPKSAIVPNDPVEVAPAPPPPPPAPPPPRVEEALAPPPASSPRPSVPGPRSSGPKVYNPKSSAPRALAPQIASDSALATISSAPRPSGPTRPLASELPKLPDIPPDAEFNGELLRTVRTALGISVPQLAERTRIGGKHIENVEADRYGALPASVYLRGILMSIAKELGLDGIRVARSYLKLYEAARPKG